MSNKALGIIVEDFKKNKSFQTVSVFTLSAVLSLALISFLEQPTDKLSDKDKVLSSVLIKTGDTETVVDKSTANVGPSPLIGSAAYNNANHVPMKEKIAEVKTSLFQKMQTGVNTYKAEKVKQNGVILDKMNVIKPSSENETDKETRSLMNE